MNIKLSNINKSYQNLEVLRDFNFEFNDGEITCILGRSGSGKTTILNILSGLADFKGRIEGIEGDISYIFQRERLIPTMTVFKNLEYVLLNKVKDKAEREQRINRIIELVGLTDKRDKFPNELSGGMTQRVSMARAFLYPSKLLLMDEPFKALDLALKSSLINAFLKLWKNDSKTVIFVTHDIDEALLLSNRIAVIRAVKNNLIETDKKGLEEKPINEKQEDNSLNKTQPHLKNGNNQYNNQIILDERIYSPQTKRSLSDPDLTALRIKLINAVINS